jgi:dienelactone hydrolase
MMGGAKAHYDGIVAFSQTDFTDDLKKINVPVLVMHGDDDQIVPYEDSAPLSAKLLKNGTLKTYKGFPHGMPTTEADTINADLLAFIKQPAASPEARAGSGMIFDITTFTLIHTLISLVAIHAVVSERGVGVPAPVPNR